MKNYIVELILLYAERNPKWKNIHEATGYVKFTKSYLTKMTIGKILMYYNFTLKSEYYKEWFELYGKN